MHFWLIDIFAGLCAVSGCLYLFGSRGAVQLSGLESARQNTLRQKLRRICGGMNLLLAIVLLGFNSAFVQHSPLAFVALVFVTMILLMGVLFLAYIDARMTLRLSRGDENGEIP